MSSDANQPTGEDTTYTLAFSFPDQLASFVHGYEAGAIGFRMQNGEAEIGTSGGFPLHAANLELFERMAAYYNYEMKTDAVTCVGHEPETFSAYANCEFKKIEGPRKPKPMLRLVTGDDE